MANRIKAARKERGWSQTRLIAELERVAARRGMTLPSRETLKSRVSRWENNHARPDEFYRTLLREALGMDDRELGFKADLEEPLAGAAEELAARLAYEMEAADTLLTALQAQTDSIRVQDRQYGAGVLLEQMRGHVNNVEGHLTHAVFDPARRALALVLADAAALAGWQALDVGAIDQAWRFFETATRAAQQGEDKALYAFARLEQAHVLGDLGNSSAAAQLAESVWEDTRLQVRPTMRCWMAAATAEMLAGAQRGRDAIAMLALAESTVDQLDGQRPPYLVFDAVHLDRWVGHTLAKLKDPAAETRIRQAASEMDSSFTRASASMTLDLAAALLQKGQAGEADRLIKQAESLARKVGSRRQLARARELRAAS
jgi:transcriptional regulator with XRE-family HTH domain